MTSTTILIILSTTMISNTIEQWKVVKLERVVEELKEEIWELDTNNRFLQHIVIIIFLDDFWYFSQNIQLQAWMVLKS